MWKGKSTGGGTNLGGGASLGGCECGSVSGRVQVQEGEMVQGQEGRKGAKGPEAGVRGAKACDKE